MIGDNVSDILLNKMNNELNTLLDSLFLLGKEKFMANKEISNILVSDLKDKDEQIKYLSFLLDNSYLNEKNIDLIEIEISYRANNNSFDVESSFISSEPDTFKSLTINGTFEQIAPKIEEFIKSCYDMYPEIVRLYTIKNN